MAEQRGKIAAAVASFTAMLLMTASSQISITTAAAASFLNIEEEEENEASLEELKEGMPWMRNNPDHMWGDPPRFTLRERLNLDSLFEDPARKYSQLFTTLNYNEFAALAEYLTPFINRARGKPSAGAPVAVGALLGVQAGTEVVIGDLG